ncbi:MAG: ankyrin repeat domain-containing protein [bacterium]|nr:ankyrin repeat domain-containing protein [bacterium]
MDDADKNRRGLKEIEQTISEGDLQALESLLDSGRLDRRVIRMAVPRAIEAELPELVGVLVSAGELELNPADGAWPLLSYAVENGSPEVVRKLCELGADPNQIWEENSARRPLHLAVDIETLDPLEGPLPELGEYDTPFTSVLLEAGADPLLEDNKGCNAIDEARDMRHRNAVHLMERYVSGRSRPLVGELKAAGDLGERASTDPIAVVILNSVREEDGGLLALSVDESDQPALRALGSTMAEAWLLLPNVSQGAERPGYSLVNRATGLALEQPNPSDEVIVGEAPRVELRESSNPFASKRCLWSLRPVRPGKGEQLWAIQDHRHAYSIGGHVGDRPRLFYWAWCGHDEQCWLIRQIGRDIAVEKPSSSAKRRWGPLRRPSD